MKLSSLNKGGGLFSGTAISANKTLAEVDLNKMFYVTAATVITLPKPQNIRASLGERVFLHSMTASAVSLVVGAGVTIDNFTGTVPLMQGIPVMLIATSGTSWSIIGVVSATQADIVAGTDFKKFVNSKELKAYVAAMSYVHPATHPASIITQDVSNRFVTDAEKGDWNGAMQGYNYIINGNFDIWQRGTSQTTSGYGSDDRWSNENMGTTKTNLRASFAVGEAFPDGVICPSYYSKTSVSSVVGAGNCARKLHKIESVKTLAGKNVLISFYAKADAAKNVSIELTQNFGSGGTPSVPIGGIGVQKISLSTTWQRYSITTAVPSIAGKVLGSNNNDFLSLSFWFDAGSSFNTRTTSLGHQSGTFDIAAVSLVEGDVDVKPIPRSIGEELALCQRYYESASLYTWAVSSAASNIAVINWLFKVSKRVPPGLTQGFITNPSGLVYTSTPQNSADGCAFAYSTVTAPGGVTISASADSEL